MVYAADTLRDTLFTNWALVSEMLPEGSPDPTMQETVRFFAYPQQSGQEHPKSVEVVKINAELDEIVEEHPTYKIVSDVYEIWVRYRVTDIQVVQRDLAEANIEDMCAEVTRIVRTVYKPSAGTSTYLTARYDWRNMDKPDSLQPELIRVLRLTLSQLRSDNATTLRGYLLALTYDDSGTSNADSKPVGGDYAYTEVQDVTFTEGYDPMPYYTAENPTDSTPVFFRGAWRGRFTAVLLAKEEDVDNSTIENINAMHLMQTEGEQAEIAFFHSTSSTSPGTLTVTNTAIIDKVTQISNTEELVKLRIEGQLTKPSTWAVT